MALTYPRLNCLRLLASHGVFLWLALTLSGLAPQVAAAQTIDDVNDPWRVMGLASVGVPLRVTRRADLGQEVLAPLFVDAAVSVLLPGRGALRHGPLLGYSTNLTIDGGFYAPVSSVSQHVIAAGYMARYALNEDWHAWAHVAVPFELSGTGSVGAELSASLAYRVLSGFGAFAALSGNLFGQEGGVSVLSAIEVGAFIDYEVLP